jgi:catechol 2,3-dioxygenase-like lactoylglutathione lyase family enzyme
VDGAMKVRSWLYTQARVADVDRSIRWYETMLGFRQVNEIRLEGGPIERQTGVPGARVRMVQGPIGGVQVELIGFDAEAPGSSRVLGETGRLSGITLSVADVLECYDTARRHDVTCVVPPVEYPPYWSLIIADPDGVHIDLTDFAGVDTDAVSGPGELGIASWLYTQVRVSDMERSIDWHAATLGFRVENEIRLEGTAIERSTGVPGIKVRMVQGSIGGVQLELIESRVGDRSPSRRRPGELGGITLSVVDVERCFAVARRLGIYCETDGPVAYPPTPYRSLIVHDPDGIRYDLTDFRRPS